MLPRPNLGKLLALSLAAGTLFGMASAGNPTVYLPCNNEDRRQSAWFGANTTGIPTGLTDQTLAWKSVGSTISSIRAAYEPISKCITGLLVGYGYANHGVEYSAVLGKSEDGSWSSELLLKPSELVVRVDAKYTKRCIEWLRFTTNTNRTVVAGAATSKSLQSTTLKPPQTGGFLSALKGHYLADPSAGIPSSSSSSKKGLSLKPWEDLSTKAFWPQRNGSSITPTSLLKLQLVWSNCAAPRQLEVAVTSPDMAKWLQQMKALQKSSPGQYAEQVGNYSLLQVPSPHAWPTWLVPLGSQVPAIGKAQELVGGILALPAGFIMATAMACDDPSSELCAKMGPPKLPQLPKLPSLTKKP